jgi:hypothetical protein
MFGGYCLFGPLIGAGSIIDTFVALFARIQVWRLVANITHSSRPCFIIFTRIFAGPISVIFFTISKLESGWTNEKRRPKNGEGSSKTDGVA